MMVNDKDSFFARKDKREIETTRRVSLRPPLPTLSPSLRPQHQRPARSYNQAHRHHLTTLRLNADQILSTKQKLDEGKIQIQNTTRTESTSLKRRSTFEVGSDLFGVLFRTKSRGGGRLGSVRDGAREGGARAGRERERRTLS